MSLNDLAACSFSLIQRLRLWQRWSKTQRKPGRRRKSKRPRKKHGWSACLPRSSSSKYHERLREARIPQFPHTATALSWHPCAHYEPKLVRLTTRLIERCALPARHFLRCKLKALARYCLWEQSEPCELKRTSN